MHCTQLKIIVDKLVRLLKSPVEVVSLFVYLASSKKKETWPGQERLKCVEGSLRGAKNTQQSSEARVPQIRKK